MQLGYCNSLIGQNRPRNSFVGALDGYTTNLAGAWSVARRLLASYEGPLIRVRRDSDNAEQDIGYNFSGELDTATITTFIGSNSAYVAKVYAQSGGINWENAIAATQPMIANAGALITNELKPALLFDKTRNTKMALASSMNVQTFIVTAKLNSSYDYPGLITNASSLNIIIGGAAGINWFPPALTGSVFVNGVDITATLTPFGFDTHCFSVVGTVSSNGVWQWGTERNIVNRYFDGPSTEMVFYSNAPSFRADVEAQLMSYLSIA